MNYKTLYTSVGLALVSQAVSQQRTIEITHFAVGDGNGNAIEPIESMTQLVREKYRSTVNRIYQDPENENKYTAEMLIPVSVEGFVVREIALFDRNGNMIIVGSTPEVYKPTLAQGMVQDSVYRIPFVISNPEVLQLNFDPNVIIATHQWILNTLTPANMFPGGTIGQVLKKNSNADGDTEWADAGSAEVFVNTIEEEQSLVAGQLIVDLSTTTTHGAAVYIEGNRISNKAGVNGWLATTDTRITLGQAYAGAKILIVQNEPLGAAPYPLAQKNNLSDIQNKSLARQNLGVMSADEAKFNDCPPGTVVTLASQNIPTGYRLLKCNGAAYSRTVYADLYAAIGTYFGAGDSVNTFNVPDARAEFPRYADDGRGIDVGRLVGSKQTQQVLKHKHLSFGEATGGWIFGNSATRGFMGTHGGIDRDNYLYFTNDGTEYNNENPNPTGTVGNENRPRNIAWLACIRY